MHLSRVFQAFGLIPIFHFVGAKIDEQRQPVLKASAFRTSHELPALQPSHPEAQKEARTVRLSAHWRDVTAQLWRGQAA